MYLPKIISNPKTKKLYYKYLQINIGNRRWTSQIFDFGQNGGFQNEESCVKKQYTLQRDAKNLSIYQI